MNRSPPSLANPFPKLPPASRLSWFGHDASGHVGAWRSSRWGWGHPLGNVGGRLSNANGRKWPIYIRLGISGNPEPTAARLLSTVADWNAWHGTPRLLKILVPSWWRHVWLDATQHLRMQWRLVRLLRGESGLPIGYVWWMQFLTARNVLIDSLRNKLGLWKPGLGICCVVV